MNPADFPDWLKPPNSLQPTSGISDFLRNYGTTNPPAPTISPSEKSSVQKLQDSVAFGKKLLENKRANKATMLQWAKQTRFAAFSLFGKDAAIGKNSDLLVKEADHPGLTLDQFAQRLADAEALLDYLKKMADDSLSCRASFISRAPSTKNVFIIHGHDKENALLLSHLLRENLELNPVVMLAKPGMGRPLTDKFEEEAKTCSFAFALFTPDDEVFNSAQTYSQARPNVIYETGWFIGRLGRQRVIIILKEGTEIHTDLHGVSQIRFATSVDDKFLEIQKELKAAKIIR
jgi:predicted nucleotide-binding protein